jgi:hypothetical protein
MIRLAGPVRGGDSCGRYDRDGFRRSCFRRTSFKRVGCVSSKPIWKTGTNAPRCFRNGSPDRETSPLNSFRRRKDDLLTR